MSQNGGEDQDQLHRQSPPLLVQNGGKDDLDVVIANRGGIVEAAGNLVDNVISATSASTWTSTSISIFSAFSSAFPESSSPSSSTSATPLVAL
jgi:hypothetical protein